MAVIAQSIDKIRDNGSLFKNFIFPPIPYLYFLLLFLFSLMDRATRTTLIESSESSLSIGDQPIERISKETKYLGIILDRDQYIHRLTRGLLQGLHLFNSSFRRVNPNDIVHIPIESLSKKKKKNYLPSINRSRTLPPTTINSSIESNNVHDGKKCTAIRKKTPRRK